MKQTAVYVTGVPEDATADELAAHFSRAGIVLDDPASPTPRPYIKLYGSSDALVVYLREESVALAVQLLDESQLRTGCMLHVEPARFDPGSAGGGDKSEARLAREEWKRRMEKLHGKLRWEEEGAKEARSVEKRLRLECTCLLYNMFTRLEIEEDPGTLLDVEEDVRTEASKLGAVRSVVLVEEEECVAVRFTERESAVLCIARMDGRWYSGRRITARLYDGSFRIKDKKHGQDESMRLDTFGDCLEE